MMIHYYTDLLLINANFVLTFYVVFNYKLYNYYNGAVWQFGSIYVHVSKETRHKFLSISTKESVKAI
jgi:hypothetical protein